MADNFNLRTFLAENKLTKNAKLLKEEEDNLGQPQRKVDYKTLEVDGVDGSDYPDFVDAYLSYGEYEDGTPLTDGELQELDPDGAIAQEMASEEYTEGGGYDDYEDPDDFDENTMTKREKYLTRIVENALGLEVTEDDNVDYTMGNQDDPNQLPNPASQISIPEGDEMADETVIPEYRTIDELMKSIDHGTNKVAEEHKMQEMKKIAEALRIKAKRMEESEHAAHISPKDLKQLATDAAKLEKAAEKLKAAFDKKFNKKEKPAAAPKAEKVEALQEGTFDLKKFLVENKMTYNSRLLSEVAGLEQYRAGMKLHKKGKPDETFTIQLVQPGTTKGMEAAMALHLKDDNTGREFKDSPGDYEIVKEGIK